MINVLKNVTSSSTETSSRSIPEGGQHENERKSLFTLIDERGEV